MFNQDFYPTPNSVIERILSSVNVVNQVVLEPSAGSGNIVSYLKNAGAKEVIACEIEPKLRSIVEKECRIIKDDFLHVQSHEVSHVDAIVMNPPFSNQDKHIMHAWDVAPAGSQIVAICSTNMLRNRYSEGRRIINDLVKLHGRSEHLGDVFLDAERRTGVDCSVVYLYKPIKEDDDFSDFFSLDEEVDEQEDGILRYNYVRDIVSRYTEAIRLFDEIMPIAQRMNELTKPISTRGIKFGAFNTDDREYTGTITRDEYKKALQKQCWEKIFKDMNMDKYVTQGVRDNINKFVEKQVHVPFTMKNIYKMLEIIVGTHGSRMQQVLIEAFETICSYSYENSTAGEKWKTNSDYMVNKKFIIPGITEGYGWGGEPQPYIKIHWNGYQKIDDIQKALCNLMGLQYDDIGSIWELVHANKLDWAKWHNWGFFKIRAYKKGTIHFQFKDDNVWTQFNLEVAKAKGWRLPTVPKARKTSKKQTKEVDLFR